MDWRRILLLGAAGLGALAQVFFAYKEMSGWTRAFVANAAPGWIDPSDPNTDGHIEWARQLAFNMGAYNLVLAVGLAWIVYAVLRDQGIAHKLGYFFAFWFLFAAAVAHNTGVPLAAKAQGALGILLLAATALWHLRGGRAPVSRN
jgi:hypothetical protein